jgi:cyclophilin family peptidyl-prolyl cis-trans isomerase
VKLDGVYRAKVSTSAGDLSFYLYPEHARETVNSFIVLARYHFWDGAPLTTIVPNTAFVVGDPIQGGPGYTIPNETPPVGAIYPVGTPTMVARGDGPVDPGTWQVALGEDAAGFPKNTPAFGILEDGLPTLQAIRKAGSQSGLPTQAVTINSITVTEAPASTDATSDPATDATTATPAAPPAT